MNDMTNELISIKRSISFRPQQGLTIMNPAVKTTIKEKRALFPSPTGVNYYESLLRV